VKEKKNQFMGEGIRSYSDREISSIREYDTIVVGSVYYGGHRESGSDHLRGQPGDVRGGGGFFSVHGPTQTTLDSPEFSGTSRSRDFMIVGQFT